MPCQAIGAGRAGRGDRNQGRTVVGEQSEELDGKELRGALGGKCNLETRGSPFLDIVYPSIFIDYSVILLILKSSSCTAVHYQTVSPT